MNRATLDPNFATEEQDETDPINIGLKEEVRIRYNGIINKLTRRSKGEGEKRMASENGGNDRRRVLMMGGIG